MQKMKWLELGVWLLLLSFVTGLKAEDVEYRFERMVPQLDQPWYFYKPKGIAVAPDGSIWVADSENYRIQHLSADGDILLQGANGQINNSRGLVVTPDGSLFLSDTYNHRIQHINAAGETIGVFGSLGSQPGQFNEPSGITLASDGTLWVADYGNNRIQHLKTDGTFILMYICLL